ncbi:hypothetical protein HKD37_01G001032 [Glycine soja]
MTVVYKSKGETKDIELVEEEEARIGADSSSATSNKSKNYKEEPRNAAQKHKAKRVESVNVDAEAFDCSMHSEAEALEHMKKKDTGHRSVSLENKTRDSTVLKIGDSAKVVIKQDMKGRRHKYGFNNNKREKPEKVRVVDDEIGDKHQLDEVLRMPSTCIMGSPPASPPPPPPTPPSHHPLPPTTTPSDTSASPPPGAERPVVHVDHAIGKADGPHRKKLRTYLGIVACDKVDVTYENWKEVPTAQKDLIWEDIQAKFDILEASDNLTKKWALAADQDSVEDTIYEKYDISKEKWAQLCQTRRDPSWEDVRKKAQAIQKQNTAPHILSRGGYDYLEQKLLAEKMKKKLEEAAQSRSIDGVIDPPSPVRRHVKWKMAHTKKTGEKTTKAAKEIAEKIVSHIGILHPPWTSGCSHRCYWTSRAPWTCPCCWSRGHHQAILWINSADVPQLFLPASRRIAVVDLANQGPTRGVHHIKSDAAAHGIIQPDVVPDSVPDAISGTCTASRPSGWSLQSSNPARLVAMGRFYEGSTIVHNTPLLSGQVKVSVEEVTDADAPVPVPIDEVSLVGQALHTFLAWPTHLVVVSPAKPPPKPDPEVDDLLYLMTLTIPELFLRPYQVRWDATVFGVFNPDFPLYIKHEDLSEIAHGGQCLSISVLQLWILHLTETCMRAGNYDIYGFLEPQSIQRSGQSLLESESYIKTWMQSSKRDVYLGAYLNGEHWQMVVILPKEHLVVWFCSLHIRPDNYLKGIINSALKGLDDAPQPKSKAPARWIVVKCNRQKGSTECGYNVMHWMSTIILGTFRNNREAYFNDPRPLEPERLKALRIQWAQFYLRVRDQT